MCIGLVFLRLIQDDVVLIFDRAFEAKWSEALSKKQGHFGNASQSHK